MTTRGERIHNTEGAKIISTRSAGLKGPGGRGARWAGRVAAVATVALVAACGTLTPVTAGDDGPQRVDTGTIRSIPPMGYNGNNEGQLREVRMPLSDGRTVTCVLFGGYKQGGLSCDWSGAR